MLYRTLLALFQTLTGAIPDSYWRYTGPFSYWKTEGPEQRQFLVALFRTLSIFVKKGPVYEGIELTGFVVDNPAFEAHEE